MSYDAGTAHETQIAHAGTGNPVHNIPMGSCVEAHRAMTSRIPGAKPLILVEDHAQSDDIAVVAAAVVHILETVLLANPRLDLNDTLDHKQSEGVLSG